MFYYYGAKNLLSRYYPAPKYDLIIEPFAGSAAYSCFHLLKNSNLKCILIEKNIEVVDSWNFLLNCSREDIENFPEPKIGEYTSEFLIKTCSASNASSKCNKMKYSERISRVFNIQKRRILKFLDIRNRIKVINGDYRNYPNVKATWFIDPPYQVKNKNSNTVFSNGNGYSNRCNADNINYTELSNYCLSRYGQIIVCEKEGADWLDFKVFRTNKTSLNKKYNEVIFTNRG